MYVSVSVRPMLTDLFDQVVQSVISLVRLPISIEHHLGGTYLGSAAMIVVFLYGWRNRDKGTNCLRGFLRYCFPKEIWAHASSSLDRRLFLVNNTLLVVLIAPLMVSSGFFAYYAAGVLEASFGSPEPALPVTWQARLLMGLSAVLAADLGWYVSHVLFHKIPLLWEFHKVHHSAEVLTPITDERFHPVELVVSRCFSGGATGLVLAAFDYLFGYSITTVTLAGMNIFALAFMMTTANLTHSHVWITFGQTLGRVFISPAQHQIHHSMNPKHRDRNFGASFALWDWFFGTLYVPRNFEELRIGLSDTADRNAYRSLASLYFRPLLGAGLLVCDALRSIGARVYSMSIGARVNRDTHTGGEL